MTPFLDDNTSNSSVLHLVKILVILNLIIRNPQSAEVKFLVQLPFILEAGATASFLDFCSNVDLNAMAARSQMSKHNARWARRHSN